MPPKTYLVGLRYLRLEVGRMLLRLDPRVGGQLTSEERIDRRWAWHIQNRRGFPKPYYTQSQAAMLHLPEKLYEKREVDAFLHHFLEPYLRERLTDAEWVERVLAGRYKKSLT